MQTLSTQIKTTRVSNAVAAGATTVDSNIINTVGFSNHRFVFSIGAITAGAVLRLRLQQGNAANLSDAEDLDLDVDWTDTDDNRLGLIECVLPSKRYLRARVERATQNTVLDGIVCEQYNARNLPTTDDATTVKHRTVSVTPNVDN